MLSTLISVDRSLKLSYPDLPAFSLKSMVVSLPAFNASTNNNKSNVEKLDHVMKEVLRISLYQSLLPNELEESLLSLGKGDLSASELVNVLEDGLPREVSQDEECMQWLSVCTRRINQMQLPRYVKLHEQLNALMKVFISKDNVLSFANDKDKFIRRNDSGINIINNDNEVAENNTDTQFASGSSCGVQTLDCTKAVDIIDVDRTTGMLNLHHKFLQDHIDNLPWNVKKRDSLVHNHGYVASFWRDKEHQLDVTTNGEFNLEENLRQSLLTCYAEYVEIMERLGIPSVLVDGASVKSGDVFSDECSLVDLKGRRSIVVKV